VAGGRRYSQRRVQALAEHIVAATGGCTLRQLCNLMFLCDLEAYRQLGKSITGATYVKMPWGALPLRKRDADRFRTRRHSY
jgi:hypothetical protein